MCVACSHNVRRASSHLGWNHDFPSPLFAKPGETIHFERIECTGGQLGPHSTLETVSRLDFGIVKPVTGPVHVEGAEPGDALKVPNRVVPFYFPRIAVLSRATDTSTSSDVLAVDGLSVDALTPEGRKRVLDGVSFSLKRGETLCLAGESGSGKSVSALSIMRLLPPRSLTIAGGAIRFDGQDLTRLGERAMRQLRGGRIAMVFQEPMTSLNPVITIGRQLVEAITEHQEIDAGAARVRARRNAGRRAHH